MNLTEATKILTTIWRTVRQNNPDVLDNYKMQAIYYPSNINWHKGRTPDYYVRDDTMYINVASVIDYGGVEVLQNMLHEAAHSIARTIGVNEVSRQGKYHNRQFYDIARSIGVVCSWTKNGCSDVDITFAIAKKYKVLLSELEQVCKM